ncbi:hypothetical protein IA54_014915 [Xanthomonas phaseoli pv. syngonii LMG 9055]|uniref:Integrase catalytic domain-containing protein n=1 Tax=Xanthomonas phaseoli pv. syngonii LMG 9055 TaxID=1437878 RepID=A0A1V9GND6_9XANT|nr:hypothetical protein IA54_014915 [Xanthomonas phaseoli pv. syngonii LMG 9055]
MSVIPLTLEEVQAWPEPIVTTLPLAKQSQYERRRDALLAMTGGLSLKAAANKHGVREGTLNNTLEKARTLAPDGVPWGWRACIAHRIRGESPGPTRLPEKAAPSAFKQLVRHVEGLQELLDGFKGRLPTRIRASSQFERFFEKVLAHVRKRVGNTNYPLNAPDKGRRALLEYLKRARKRIVETEPEGEANEAAESKQLQQVFEFDAMERLEFDAHKMDADLYMEVENTKGRSVLRKIPYVWLLLVIDSVSRLILGWSLVLGRAYTQIDVLHVFSVSLLPWEPRDLLVPQMKYVVGSGVGTSCIGGQVLRGIVTAADNAMAHHAKLTTTNLLRYQRGVIHLGWPRVPETRGVLEAMFRQMANGAIRMLPGGFEPARDHQTPKHATTPYNPKDYPINLEAVHDLLDVIMAGHNATSLDSLHDHSALDVVRRHVQAGRWSFESSRNAEDAERLMWDLRWVTIKGNAKDGRQPYVNFMRARYRGFGMRDRWDLVGKKYLASYNLNDLRYLNLINENGELFAKLTALPPWSRTRHDFDLRKLISRWSKHGLFSIAGADDAVDAYRAYVKSHASTSPLAPTQMAHLHPRSDNAQPVKDASTEHAFVPRGGSVNFDYAKDPTK